MITYKDLFKLIKALPETGCITASESSEVYRKLRILDNFGIVQAAELDEGYLAFYPIPKKTPALVVLDTPQSPENATPSDLGRVRVDWSGRGYSSGSYKVTAIKGDYLQIAFELDVPRTMTVSKKRTEAA